MGVKGLSCIHFKPVYSVCVNGFTSLPLLVGQSIHSNLQLGENVFHHLSFQQVQKLETKWTWLLHLQNLNTGIGFTFLTYNIFESINSYNTNCCSLSLWALITCQNDTAGRIGLLSNAELRCFLLFKYQQFALVAHDQALWQFRGTAGRPICQ